MEEFYRKLADILEVPEVKPADVMCAHVADDEVGLASIADLKHAMLRMQAKLQSLKVYDLRLRLSR